LCGLSSVLILYLATQIKTLSFPFPKAGYYLLGAVLLFLTIPGATNPSAYSMTYFLGPLIQHMHGHTLLIDVESQYGLGNIWFLSPLFKLWGGVSFNKAFYLYYLFHLGSFIWIPCLVWGMTRNKGASLLCLFISICF